MASSTLQKVILASVAACGAVLLAEGVLSLFFHRSLRPSALDRFAISVPGDSTDQSVKSWRRTAFARPHPDPRIGFDVVPGEKLDFVDRQIVIALNGTRQRVGAPPRPGALRIVVLGDSVAFGVHLADEDTIASQLETLLKGVVGPDGREIACWTLASPGWTGSNAVQSLFDHLTELAPDVVVFLPIENDLSDTLGVDDGGILTPAADSMSPRPQLHAGFETALGRVVDLAVDAKAGKLIPSIRGDEIGVLAINADLTAESHRRYDRERDAILRLRDVLEKRGSRLYVQPYTEKGMDENFAILLADRLLTAAPRLPFVAGFKEAAASFTLVNDMHPNAVGTHALATFIAERLIADQVVKPAPDRALPPLAPQLRQLETRWDSYATIHARAEALRQKARSALSSSIDTSTGRGCIQIVGGLNPDGTVGPDLVGVIRATSPRLLVRIASLDPPLVVPFTLAVQVDGKDVGRIEIAPDRKNPTEPIDARFDLAVSSGPIEVRLTPSDWTTRLWRGRRVTMACRLLLLESEADAK